MIDFNFSSDCCGCAACIDVCPTMCIDFKTDKYGWNIPVVNINKCINCHKCEKVCPHLSYKKPSNVKPRVFSAYANDENIRTTGSSGSIFYLLSEYIIKQGGVVFGAIFDSDLKVRHSKAESISEILPLTKSKYIQSDTRGVYNGVCEYLKQGRKVMFVGTPCQTVALKQLIPAKYDDNLLLVDFICHGVPGQELFDKCIKMYEHKHNRKVTNFTFRHKTPERVHGYRLEYVNNLTGKKAVETGTSDDFPFYYGYLRYNIFRDACYKCDYLGIERVSDITLGDFWFLDRIRNIQDFNKGYSMLIINSDKGQEYFSRMANGGDITSEEFPLSTAVKLNYAYTKPTPLSIVHRFYKHDYSTNSFYTTANRYLTSRLPFFRKCIRYLIVKTGI